MRMTNPSRRLLFHNAENHSWCLLDRVLGTTVTVETIDRPMTRDCRRVRAGQVAPAQSSKLPLQNPLGRRPPPSGSKPSAGGAGDSDVTRTPRIGSTGKVRAGSGRS